MKFEIGDDALVINEAKQAEQCEIITIGEGPTKKKFYELKSRLNVGNATKWYSEDEVFQLRKATTSMYISQKAINNASRR